MAHSALGTLDFSFSVSSQRLAESAHLLGKARKRVEFVDRLVGNGVPSTRFSTRFVDVYVRPRRFHADPGRRALPRRHPARWKRGRSKPASRTCRPGRVRWTRIAPGARCWYRPACQAPGPGPLRRAFGATGPSGTTTRSRAATSCKAAGSARKGPCRRSLYATAGPACPEPRTAGLGRKSSTRVRFRRRSPRVRRSRTRCSPARLRNPRSAGSWPAPTSSRQACSVVWGLRFPAGRGRRAAGVYRSRWRQKIARAAQFIAVSDDSSSAARCEPRDEKPAAKR